jgi:hypothetical protein
MSTLIERKKNESKVNLISKLAAGEDQDAFEYLMLLSSWARITDDVFDEFENITQNKVLTAIEILFIRIPSNLFFKKHRDILFSQHVSMWNAWEASNILERGDKTDQIYAHVLRDYINEILPLVALLTQGHTKMKQVNSTVRSLFKKELGE